MIGIICALNEEVQALIDAMKNKEEKTIAKLTYYKGEIHNQKVVATECGIGKVNAAMSTQIMIDTYHPDIIINSGIAGSLSKDIKIGDIVISKDCVQHDYNVTEMGGDPLGQIVYNDEQRIDIPTNSKVVEGLQKACRTLKNTSIFHGRIASGDLFIASHKGREKVASNFNALCCEMEGAAVGQVCYRNDVPYAILRCISDDFNENEFIDYMKFKPIAADKTINVLIEYIKNI